MVHWIWTIYSCGLNKGFSSKFCVGSRVPQETPEEGQCTHWLNNWGYNNNKNEGNSLNTQKDKNYHTSSKKFGQIMFK